MQRKLFSNPIKEDGKINIGKGISLEIRGGKRGIAIQYDRNCEVRRVDLSDTPAKRVFIVDLVGYKVNQSKLAKALSISRQTIHNYVERKEVYGLEGLINSYNVAPVTNRSQQRKENRSKLLTGNINHKLAEKREKERAKRKKDQPVQAQLPFEIEKDRNIKQISVEEQVFTEVHNWQENRYAGVFIYLIHLFSKANFLTLLGGYFGNLYKIFMVFILMVSSNVRSLEQLKNIRKREAGMILGIVRIPSKPKVWEWFYRAAHLKVGQKILDDFFRYQIRTGQVGEHLLFTDGHLLPYSGKAQVHCAFSTQRSVPLPGWLPATQQVV